MPSYAVPAGAGASAGPWPRRLGLAIGTVTSTVVVPAQATRPDGGEQGVVR